MNSEMLTLKGMMLRQFRRPPREIFGGDAALISLEYHLTFNLRRWISICIVVLSLACGFVSAWDEAVFVLLILWNMVLWPFVGSSLLLVYLLMRIRMISNQEFSVHIETIPGYKFPSYVQYISEWQYLAFEWFKVTVTSSYVAFLVGVVALSAPGVTSYGVEDLIYGGLCGFAVLIFIWAFNLKWMEFVYNWIALTGIDLLTRYRENDDEELLEPIRLWEQPFSSKLFKLRLWFAAKAAGYRFRRTVVPFFVVVMMFVIPILTGMAFTGNESGYLFTAAILLNLAAFCFLAANYTIFSHQTSWTNRYFWKVRRLVVVYLLGVLITTTLVFVLGLICYLVTFGAHPVQIVFYTVFGIAAILSAAYGYNWLGSRRENIIISAINWGKSDQHSDNKVPTPHNTI